MLELLSPLAAVTLAAVIFTRAVCVCYSAHPSKHRHPLLFIGFGYSYVILGASAIFSAIEIFGADVGHAPLWLMLIGSCGLIVFDRRRTECMSISHCPADGRAP